MRRTDATRQFRPLHKTGTLGASFHKLKNLKLVTPELANTFDIPAEAPVLISPYIRQRSRCFECHEWYMPLIYQIGRETVAHHFCKDHGGIYVQLIEDDTDKWVYDPGYFQAIVLPRGPIRMGNDQGYQFRSVTPKYILPVKCTWCSIRIDTGKLFERGGILIPVCETCKYHDGYMGYTEYDMGFRLTDDGHLSFTRPIPAHFMDAFNYPSRKDN